MKRASLCIILFLMLIVTMLSGCSKSASYYYKNGIKNFNDNNYEEAEKSLSKAIELNKERAEYYIDYAMTLIMLGQNEKALQYFDKAIINKDNFIVNRNNKNAFRGKGIAYYKSYQYKEAIEQFDKALAVDELSNLNMDILYYKAKSQEKAGLYKDAIESYTSIIKENPSNADTYSDRAFVYRKLGNYKNSLADYDKAISLDTNNYDYYFGKYFLLLESGKKDAATVLEDALSIKVKTTEDSYNVAKLHYYQEDYDSAIGELTEACENGFTAAYYYLGDIYEKKEDYESAVHNYKMFINDETNEKSATVYNQLGVCEIKLGEYKEALTYIQKGLEFNDTSFDQSLKQNEIVAYEHLGDFEKAYKLMKEYVILYPEDEEAALEYEFIKTRLPEAST